MFWIGTAGVPVSSRERSSESGIKRVHELGLNAMEIEFVRGVNMQKPQAEAVGKTAKGLNVKLSVHAPYFINLASEEKEKIAASKIRILESARIGKILGANIVVFHPGFYSGLSADEAYAIIRDAVIDIRKKLNEEKNQILLGPETMGRQKQFGSVDETLKLCTEVKGVVPVLDFAHVHARTNGGLKKQQDFADVLNKVEKTIGKTDLHMHMTGVNYQNGNEKNHLTIDSRQPDFSLLAAELKRRKINATIISESPNLETDALIFKKLLESKS